MGVNYANTLIAIADDCPVSEAIVPPRKDEKPTIAAEQFRLLTAQPYQLTSEDVIFEVHADKNGIPPEERIAAREAFYSIPRACLRTSPLAKKFGWGLHADAEGKLALVPVNSDRYRELIVDPQTTTVKAMRSSRSR